MSEIKTCTICSSSFQKDGTRRSICSPECFVARRLKYSEKQFPRKGKIRNCGWCKTSFVNEKSGNVKYCCPTCSLEAFAFGNKKWRMKNVNCKTVSGFKTKKNKQQQIQSKKMLIQQLEFPQLVGA